LYTLALREDEEPQLASSQRSHDDKLLSVQKDCFAPEGEATDYLELNINVPSHHPPSTPPYGIPTRRKEVLRKEQLVDKEVAKILTNSVESALLHVRNKTETHQGRQKRYADKRCPPDKYLSNLILFTGHHRITPEPINPIRRRGHYRKKLSEASPSPRTTGKTRGGEYNS
jgi:DNA-binding GntR family transcriptional regulator